ncbi:MAG TPA: uracil-DNA glycosylase [Patescibacteria group bacterium]|nr:uracil-DNA glycosylase [Patescibacteria group bacterium]
MRLERVDCFKCRFLQVTWEPNFPYACQAFGFKTKNIPSVEVFRSSGQRCLNFADKSYKPLPQET